MVHITVKMIGDGPHGTGTDGMSSTGTVLLLELIHYSTVVTRCFRCGTVLVQHLDTCTKITFKIFKLFLIYVVVLF